MATYYVDTNAAAGGNGTTQLLTGATCAWDTIADVNAASFNAGDSILFRRGCTWREQLTVPSSGSAGSPITFGAYGTGADPIINGLNLITPGTAWTTYAPAVTNHVTDGAMENWVSATNLTSWTELAQGTSTVNQDTDEHSGTYAVRLDVDASNSTDVIYQINNLLASTNYTVSFWHKENGAGNYAAMYVKNQINLDPHKTWYYNGATSSWQASAANAIAPAHADNYTLASFTFTTEAAGSYEYGLARVAASSRSIWYDDLTVYVTSEIPPANVWQATCAAEPTQVYFNGEFGIHETALANLNSAKEWFWAANVLYVYAASDPDTLYTTPGVEPSARGTAVTITDKSYITIDGLVLKGGSYYGLYLYGDTDDVGNITVSNCHISYNYQCGVEATIDEGTVNNVALSDNEINNNAGNGVRASDECYAWTVSGNAIHHNSLEYAAAGLFNATAGIRVGTTVSPPTIHDWTIEHNDIYDHGESFSAAQYSGAGIWVYNSGTDMVVRFNKCHDNHHHGVELEGGVGVDWTAVEVYYNLCYSNYAGIACQTNYHDNTLYNNTCFGNQFGINIDGKGTGASNNLIKNNILAGNTGHALRVLNGGENDGVQGSGNVYVNNCLGPEGSNFIEWGEGVHKSTYDAWETAYGATTSSVEADPLFVSTITPDFALLSTSPCINAGVDVGLTTDYAGNPVLGNPDIGAYEYQFSLGGSLTLGIGITLKEG